MPGFDLKQINRNDKLIVGGGIVVFLASFMPYWGYSFHGFSSSTSAWTGYAILGLLFLFAAAGITALRLFGNTSLPTLPVGVNLLVTGLAALGTLLVIIRAYTYPHASGFGGSVGVMWGGYILFIAAIVETVGAVMNFRASGEKVAWDATAMNKAPAAGSTPPAPYPPQDAAPSYPPATEPPASYPPAGTADPGAPGV